MSFLGVVTTENSLRMSWSPLVILCSCISPTYTFASVIARFAWRKYFHYASCVSIWALHYVVIVVVGTQRSSFAVRGNSSWVIPQFGLQSFQPLQGAAHMPYCHVKVYRLVTYGLSVFGPWCSRVSWEWFWSAFCLGFSYIGFALD